MSTESTHTRATPSTSKSTSKSTADLVREVTELVPRLVQEELALAKVELTEKGKHAGVGAGLFGGGGLFAFFGLALLLTAAVLGLAEAMPAWAAALIVAAVVLVVAAILVLVGRSQVKRATPPVPTAALDSTKQDVQAVKESARR
jgi:uncharacterized membrane protein YqjE